MTTSSWGEFLLLAASFAVAWKGLSRATPSARLGVMLCDRSEQKVMLSDPLVSVVTRARCCAVAGIGAV